MPAMEGNIYCGDALTAERIQNDHKQVMDWLQEENPEPNRLPDHLKKFVVRSYLFSFGWDCRVTLNHVGGAFVVRLDDVGANADVDVTSEFMLCMLEHYPETTLPRAELTYANEHVVWGGVVFIDRDIADPAHKIRHVTLGGLARDFIEAGSVPACAR